MADLDVSIKFGADTSKALDGMDAIIVSLDDIRKSADETSKGLGSTDESINDIGDAADQAAGSTDKFSGAIDGLGDSSDEATSKLSSLARASIVLSEMSKSIDAFGKGAKKFGRDFSTYITAPILGLAALSLKNLFDTGAMLGSVGPAREFALAIEGLNRNFKTFLNDIALQLAPTFKNIIGVLNTLIDAYKSLSPETKSIINGFALFAAALGPLSLALAGFISLGVKLLPVITAIGSAFGALVGFLTSPIALIAAFGASIAGIINVFAKLRAAGVGTAEALAMSFNLFVTGFNNFVTKNILKGIGLILTGFGKLTSALGLDSVSKFITDISASFSGVGDIMASQFQAAKTDVDATLATIGTSAGEAFTFGFSKVIQDATGKIQSIIGNATKNVQMGSQTESEAKKAAEEQEKLALKVAATSQQIKESITGGMTDALMDFASGAKDAGQAFADFAKQTVASMVRIATQAALMNILFPPGSSMGNMINAFARVNSFATGGLVTGPGSGTSDSILARVSNGEYVNDAKTVKHFGAEFFSNLKSMARGGVPYQSRSSIPAFADGGMVTSPSQAPMVNIKNNGSEKQVSSTSFDPATSITTIILDDISRNGNISKSLQSTFGMRRAGIR